MIGQKFPRAIADHNQRFPGPLLEFVGGLWRLPEPPIVTGSDRLRILATWFDGLDPVDSALLFRVVELNSEKV